MMKHMMKHVEPMILLLSIRSCWSSVLELLSLFSEAAASFDVRVGAPRPDELLPRHAAGADHQPLLQRHVGDRQGLLEQH